MSKFIKDRIASISDNIIATLLVAGGAVVISSLSAHSAYAQGLPLYWIIFWGLISFVLFALAANFISLIVIRHARNKREVLGKWLHDIAEKDSQDINSAVQLVHHVLSPDLRSATPHLKFHFTIFNGSVYPISVDRKIEGYISYGEVTSQRRLSKEITVSTMWIPKNCPHAQMASLEFTQWLTDEEVKYIKESNSYNCYLSLENLIINITGGDAYESIKPQPLQLVLIGHLHIN